MYQLPGLKKFPNLIHACSDKSDGNMSFLFGAYDEVLENRKEFLKKLNIELDQCIRINDVHGTEIILIDNSLRDKGLDERNEGPTSDAIITTEKNLFLFLPTGDCLPIIFYDPSQNLTSLAHLSRINTPLRFISKIITTFRTMGSRPENLYVGIGPGIHKESYMFSKEGLESRIKNPAEWGSFLIRLADGRFALDLYGYNKQLLMSAGIREENIEMSDVDTGKNKSFFSHYHSYKTGEPEGRMATVVGMRA